MRIWLDLPDNAVKQLAEQGRDVSRAVWETLATDAYRVQRITGQRPHDVLSIPSRYA